MLGDFMCSNTDVSEGLYQCGGNIRWAVTKCVVVCWAQTVVLKMRWLLYIVFGRLDKNCLCQPFPAHFACAEHGCRRRYGVQEMPSRRGMKKLASALISVGISRVYGWGSRDENCCPLEMLRDMNRKKAVRRNPPYKPNTKNNEKITKRVR